MVNLLSSTSSQKGRGPADREDGRLMSLNNHLIEVWMPDFYRSENGGRQRSKVKKAINLANIYNGKHQAEDVLISSFLPSTGGQGSFFFFAFVILPPPPIYFYSLEANYVTIL